MARGRKSYTLEEKLDQVNQQIDEYTEALHSLKEEKKDLEQKMKDKQLSELLEVVEASGKSIEEVKAMLS